jgi:two-component system sensor histidine kinase/response regulator
VHDLKNPVHSMDLHAQLLLRTKGIPATARESAERIRDEARALSRLILNLLDVSKAEEGQLSPVVTEVDLAALVGSVLDSMAMKAKDRTVALEHTLAVTKVKADVDLLRRVLENLVDNALRHAPKASVVHLGAAAQDGWVEIRVRDSGRGVPADMREKIFERFVQVESSDQLETRAGRGLGLTFCRLAVEALAGKIHIEDAAPGAAFVIVLPVGD